MTQACKHGVPYPCGICHAWITERQAVSAMLLIGADNVSGQVETDTIRTVLDKLHGGHGYTLLDASGVWHGMPEQSTVAIVTGTRDAILTTARLLKSELRQEAIAVQWLPAAEFV